MLSFLKRWRPITLLASWILYWAALAGVTLWPAFAAIWRATHAAPGQGNFTLTFADGAFTLLVTISGGTIWRGSIGLLSLALLVAGPPLLVWVAWLTQRPRRAAVHEPIVR